MFFLSHNDIDHIPLREETGETAAKKQINVMRGNGMYLHMHSLFHFPNRCNYFFAFNFPLSIFLHLKSSTTVVNSNSSRENDTVIIIVEL